MVTITTSSKITPDGKQHELNAERTRHRETMTERLTRGQKAPPMLTHRYVFKAPPSSDPGATSPPSSCDQAQVASHSLPHARAPAECRVPSPAQSLGPSVALAAVAMNEGLVDCPDNPVGGTASNAALSACGWKLVAPLAIHNATVIPDVKRRKASSASQKERMSLAPSTHDAARHVLHGHGHAEMRHAFPKGQIAVLKKGQPRVEERSTVRGSDSRKTMGTRSAAIWAGKRNQHRYCPGDQDPLSEELLPVRRLYGGACSLQKSMLTSFALRWLRPIPATCPAVESRSGRAHSPVGAAPPAMFSTAWNHSTRHRTAQMAPRTLSCQHCWQSVLFD